jgi:hypothetical protein
MYGRYEGITKMHLLLTEPSQVSEVGPGEGEQQGRPCRLGDRLISTYPLIPDEIPARVGSKNGGVCFPV